MIVATVFIVGAVIVAVGAGLALAGETDPGPGVVFLFATAILMLIGVSVAIESVDVRWAGWAECVDGVTQVDNVIIADCDGYYKLPGRDNSE
jgi:hypothetical protein